MSTFTKQPDYFQVLKSYRLVFNTSGMVKLACELYDRTEKSARVILQDKKKSDMMKHALCALLISGSIYNLAPKAESSSGGSNFTTSKEHITEAAPKEVTQMDENFYPYPHLRVERGGPKIRRLDYSTSAYIAQVAGGFFGRYLTIETPGKKIGDGKFIRTLDQMYAVKTGSYGKTSEVERLRETTYATYNETRIFMTLGQRVRGVDQVIGESNADMNYQTLCVDKWIRLSATKCQILKNIASKIDGRILTAVQMTETFDKATPGTTNAWVLDQMYKFQSREAVDAIPSLAGGIPVVGPFQITEQLVGDSKTRPYPITVVSNHGRSKLPLTIFEFKRTDHEKGAWNGFVYDIARLLRELDDSEARLLEASFVKSKEDFVRFLAASHRGSGDARTFAMDWIHDGAINPLSVFERQVADRDYSKYAETAWKNHKGLDSYLKEILPSVS
jgi:hypothetical protein